MKKIVLGAAFFAAFFCAESFAQKASFSVRTGSTGFFKRDVSQADSRFDGAYSLFAAQYSSDSLRFYAKSKMKLKESQTFEDLSTSSTWEKAWCAFSLPIFPRLWIYGGHGFALCIPGSFFSILDSDYADGTRFGKDGLALNFEGNVISAGFSFKSDTSTAKLSEKLNLGAGVCANLSSFEIPLEFGASVIYDNAKNSKEIKTLSSKKYETESGIKEKIYEKSADYGALFSDARDFTASASVRFFPEKDFSVSAIYSINAEPIVSDTIFKRVENTDKFTALEHSHIFSSVAKARAFDTVFDANAEIARSFDGGLWSFFAAVRAKKQIFSVSSWKFCAYPDARFFKIAGAGKEGRESLVLRPCFTAEFSRHYFKFGAEIERREMKDGVFHWIVSIPAYYKFSL